MTALFIPIQPRVVSHPKMVLLPIALGALFFALLIPAPKPRLDFAAGVSLPPVHQDDTAPKAGAILKDKCGKCHGRDGDDTFVWDAKSFQSIVKNKEVKAGDPAGSAIIDRIEKKSMPPKGNPAVTEDELATLKKWISDGPKDFADQGSHDTAIKISEGQIYKEIIANLDSVPEADRPYMRYFSTANLLRDGESSAQIKKYETALSKLLNSLTWSPDIVKLKPFGTGNNLYRLDIRDVTSGEADWTKLWGEILKFYPYGYVPKGQQGAIDQIKALSGARIPYVRVDWFLSNASIPPLYHEILALPKSVLKLEDLLGVNARQDQDQDRVVRGGLFPSGVSDNNRAVERHRSKYGYYWKSFDFASNAGRKHIDEYPLDFQEDGGEFIFSLPNGMQGYFIAKGDDRLDVAPSNIVHDKTHTFKTNDVINGLSCMSCHANGVQFFKSTTRQHLDSLQRASFDLDRAKLWYVAQEKLDDVQISDAEKFVSANQRIGIQYPHKGNFPDLSVGDEPITGVVQLYKLNDVSISEAASDCALSPEEFAKRVNRSSLLADKGISVLANAGTKIPRDVWEQNFAYVVDELGLGTYIAPTRHGLDSSQDTRLAVSVRTRGNSLVLTRLRSHLLLRLSSNEVRTVDSGERTEKSVTISALEGSDELVLKADLDGRQFQSSGDAQSFDTIAEKLTDDLHRALTGKVAPGLSPATERAFRAAAPTVARQEFPATPLEKLIQQASKSGTIGASLSTDRGPGGVYHVGEFVTAFFGTTQSCVGAIYDVDSTGAAILLFPNTSHPDNHLQGGVPQTGDTWKLHVSSADGRERLLFLAAASNDQLPGVNEFLGNPAKTVSKHLEAVANTVQQQSQASGGALGVSIVEFVTVP